MKFEWDEASNRANIRKHALDFADAEEMFRGLRVVDPDTREDYGERRWTGVGSIRAHRVSGLHGAWPGYSSHHLTEKGGQP
jgi:uncharacterized DUF497 family protein